jgi:hypothetical protein
MARSLWAAGAATAALFLAGCATGPLVENPLLIRARDFTSQENPLYIPQGPTPSSYAQVFEKTIDIIDDFFEIAYASRYEGRIETFPATAPGLEQPWKPGSPDFAQRLLATLQSIRHRAVVTISTADDGGYFIDVKVFKELEDLPSPFRYTAGTASFRMNSTVERQFDVIDPTIYDYNWIPIGRDLKLEQVLLSKLAHFDLTGTPKTPPPANPPASNPPGSNPPAANP